MEICWKGSGLGEGNDFHLYKKNKKNLKNTNAIQIYCKKQKSKDLHSVFATTNWSIFEYYLEQYSKHMLRLLTD